MTIRNLRIFVAVYQTMNVTRAADLLHMTQPAVTRAVRELEDYYGVQLFERMNHRLQRTTRGDEMYTRATNLLGSFDDLENEIRNWDEIGILRVGSTLTLGNYLMPKVVPTFQRSHPKLRLRVTIANSRTIQQAILNNELDIAMVEGRVNSEYLTSEILGTDQMCLVLPPDHPLCTQKSISIHDLAAFPMLLREKGSAGRDFVDSICASHGLELHPIWESISTQALIHAVIAGIGISILPEMLVQQDLAEHRVNSRSIADASFCRTNYIIFHKGKYLTDSARAFMSCCCEAQINR